MKNKIKAFLKKLNRVLTEWGAAASYAIHR